jgi:hypothetical protein
LAGPSLPIRGEELIGSEREGSIDAETITRNLRQPVRERDKGGELNTVRGEYNRPQVAHFSRTE